MCPQGRPDVEWRCLGMSWKWREDGPGDLFLSGTSSQMGT